MPYLIFTLIGYLSGSILYSRLLPSHFRNIDIETVSDDGNPGAGNVFKNCGTPLGILCLACDLLKGAIPVSFCLHYLDWEHPMFALALASPVLGHAKKGKAIAVSFGVLIGLLPFHLMVFYLVLPFVFFSTLIRVNPHAWRVIFSFVCFFVLSLVCVSIFSLRLGALLIALIVIAKHVAFLLQAREKLQIHGCWRFHNFRNRRQNR